MIKNCGKLYLALLLSLPVGLACGQQKQDVRVPSTNTTSTVRVQDTNSEKAGRGDSSPIELGNGPQMPNEETSKKNSFGIPKKPSFELLHSGLVSETVLESGELRREFDFGDESADYLTQQAWAAQGEKDYEAVWAYTQRCINLYAQEARRQQQSLSSFPLADKRSEFAALNNVAACYFIRAEALMRQEKLPEARQAFQFVLNNYGYAQYWDPRGWFWKVAEKSRESIDKLDGLIQGEKAPAKEAARPRPPASTLTLFDPGTEPVVDYAKYGRFENIGTKDYRYVITDQAGLSRACGEGVYPNSAAARRDPAYLALKGSDRLNGNHWDFLYSDDMQANFFKWTTAPEPAGVKQYYIAFALERAGLIGQALKAYYAVVVHFPQAYGWTYWHTPWYVGPVAIGKINYLLRRHPELGLRLEGAMIKVENSFDNEVSNDSVITNPGCLVKSATSTAPPVDLRAAKIGQRIGGPRIELVRYENGHWQLLVDKKPYPVRAVTYSPTKVGQSPDEGTLANWMEEDTDQNGKVDGPYDAWVDKNGNNVRDEDEPAVGDFQLMKEMGVNTLRAYHHPAKANKALLKALYKNYGLMTIMGDFLGAYAIGSGAAWNEGTDYTNAAHQKNMLEGIRQMVTEFKDEEWVLFWLLGNENNYGVANNAKENPRAYYQFVNTAARLVHQLDPTRPVALCNGDALFLDIFAQEAPQVDIFGANAYRGKQGFGNFWQDVRDECGKAALITEYGCGAYYEGQPAQVAEAGQADYHQGSWEDIQENMAGRGAGNALGGVIFEWLDEWWKAYEPARHDWKGQFYGPFPDGYMHEEWLGLCAQGDGRQSPFLRHLRKSYYMYQELWSK